MSSLVVMLPRGHRVKVSTNPNMALLAIKDTACTKKGLDPQIFTLEYKGRKVDLSTTVRFSGIPNNGTLELVELSQEEIGKEEKVTVCLQLPSGARLVDTFTPPTSLMQVISKWSSEAGDPSPGEERVVVYTRQEVVGDDALNATTLRSLGLLQGKCLLRLMHKVPESLKVQANVYAIKEKEREGSPEKFHRPMRLEAATLPKKDEVNEETKEEEPMDLSSEPKSGDLGEKSTQVGEAESSPVATTSTTSSLLPTDVHHQSSSVPLVAPVINLIPPHGAIVFKDEDGLSATSHVADIGDDFFDLSIDEVKSRQRDLRDEVKRLEEGGQLLTKGLREQKQESEKLGVLAKYKTGMVRVRLPCRHIVQGEFPPNTTISDILDWISPLLASPLSPPAYLYTAPPHTRLDKDSNLLDLDLFPAALLHLSTTSPGPQHLAENVLSSLSNSVGAQQAAAESRQQSIRRVKERGIDDSGLQRVPDSRSSAGTDDQERISGAASGASSSVAGGQKLPKWFKPGK